jgi:hypothetical protein
MATTETFDFNPDMEAVTEDAFERCGLELKTANDLRMARRSLNMLQLEWSNKGLNLWTIEEQSIPNTTIVQGTSTYDIDIDTISILDAVIRKWSGDTNLQVDFSLSRLSATNYSHIPKKLQQGLPLQYYFDRIGIKDHSSGNVDRNPTVSLWPVPDADDTYEFVYWRMKRMADAGTSASNTFDVPDRFIPALTAGLAYRIAEKRAVSRVATLKASYNELFNEAYDEDRNKEDHRILPDLRYY